MSTGGEVKAFEVIFDGPDHLLEDVVCKLCSGMAETRDGVPTVTAICLSTPNFTLVVEARVDKKLLVVYNNNGVFRRLVRGLRKPLTRTATPTTLGNVSRAVGRDNETRRGRPPKNVEKTEIASDGEAEEG